MIRKVVILTFSEKWGKKCIVAYDVESEELLRLVSNAEDGAGIENRYVTNIDLLDEVQVDIIRTCQLEHQTENVLINLQYGFKKTGRTADYKLLDMLRNRERTIFGNNNYKLMDTVELEHSIEIIKFDNMYFTYNDNKKIKANFISNNCLQNNYSITDHNYFGHTESIESGYAVISLPPTDDFTGKYGYFKYVSAIYAN